MHEAFIGVDAFMVEGSAAARLGRALNTRTTQDARSSEFKVGDQVDFYRPNTHKDVSGWWGPAEIFDLSQITRGQISIRFAARDYVVSTRFVRPHMAFFVGFNDDLWPAEHL